MTQDVTESQQLELFNAPDPSLALVENEHTAKHRAEALANGLTLLSKSVRGKGCRRYRFNACGHIADIAIKSVRVGEFKCQPCHAQKLIDEAADRGLTLLSKSVGKGRVYRRYRFNACGHEDDLAINNVRRGQFKCKTCLDSKHKDEAEKRGLKILGRGQRGHLYRRYLLACGCEADIQVGGVRNGYFKCPTCGDHSCTKPSEVYLIQIDPVGKESFLKFGYAKNVKGRIARYGLPKNVTHKVLKTVSFGTGKEAREFEQTAHCVWQEDKIKPTCQMREGFSECYPLSMQETIIQAMEAI